MGSISGSNLFLIDGRALQERSAVRGIGTYLRSLLRGYAALGALDEVSLLLNRGAPPPPETALLGVRTAGVGLPRAKRRIQAVVDPFTVAWALHRARPRLYHGVEYGQPLTAPCPVVITVHDLIPFVLPHLYPWLRRERLLALRLLRRADAVVVDSAATAADVVRIARVDQRRVTVIPLGVDLQPPPAEDEVARATADLGIHRPFLLAVGTFDPRKDIAALTTAAARVRRDHNVDLVIAGDQGDFAGRVRAAVDAAGLTEHTHLLGHVSDEALRALYAAARCLMFTSRYEGFGLPPLEAMAAGTPVAMFANSSLTEVGGDVAMMVTDGDAQALAGAVTSLLDDPGEHLRRSQAGRRRAAAFTWEETARRTLQVYRGLTG